MFIKNNRGISSILLVVGTVVIIGAVAVGTVVIIRNKSDDLPDKEGMMEDVYSDEEVENANIGTEDPYIPSTSASVTMDVASFIKNYYQVLNRGKYSEAWTMWEGGTPSNDFMNQILKPSIVGYDTKGVTVKIVGAVQTEGAAGSTYATVPVEVELTLANGEKEVWRGRHILRRSNIVPPTESEWKIRSADLERVKEGEGSVNNLSILSPVAGEVLKLGTYFEVKWKGQNSKETVSLSLVSDSANFRCRRAGGEICPQDVSNIIPIADDLVNDGRYNWRVSQKIEPARYWLSLCQGKICVYTAEVVVLEK